MESGEGMRDGRTDGRTGLPQNKTADFSDIPCSDGSRTFCLLWTYTALESFLLNKHIAGIVRPYQTACA